MPFVLVTVGILMIVTGAQGTYKQFGSQVANDFTGPGNFSYWTAAIGAVGAVGYIQALQTISRLLIALIIISMFLANKGFFAKLQQTIQAGPKTPQPGLSLGATPPNSSSLVSPAQGVQQGNKGVGIDWATGIKNALPAIGSFFGF